LTRESPGASGRARRERSAHDDVNHQRPRARSSAAFDANNPASLQSFFRDLPTPIDHVMVTGGGPHYKPPLEMTPEERREELRATLPIGRVVGPADVAALAVTS
jgi:hypothetical protein